METGGNQKQINEISKLLGGTAHLEPGQPPPPDPPDQEAQDTKTDDSETEALAASGEAPEKVENGEDAEATPTGEAPEQTAESESPEDGEPKATTLKDLAKTLDIETKELYAVEIPINGAESISIGTLKDTFKQHAALMEGREVYEAEKQRTQNELMVSTRQMNQLIELAKQTGQLTPQLLEAINTQHSQKMATETKALMTAIPEWTNETTRLNDFQDLVDFAGQYGFSQMEVTNSLDHRHIKLAFDAMKAKNLVRDAKRKTALQTKTGSGRRTVKPKESAINKTVADAKASKDPRVKSAAIAQLLNST